MEDTIKVLDINITTLSEYSILEKIEKYVNKSNIKYQKSKIEPQKPLVIYTPNPEIIMYARSHPWFAEIVNKGQINIPDGAGIIWTVKRKGYPIKGRIAGADLAYKLIQFSNKENVAIGLIGGKSKIALKALECLKAEMPRLKGWAEEGPDINIKYQISNIKNDYGNWDVNAFIKRVKERNTEILLVAFGFPKQEIFINEVSKKLENIVIMSVGGTFDYWSGRIKRAPKWMQNNGLEWLHRLFIEPSRFKRQIIGARFFIENII